MKKNKDYILEETKNIFFRIYNYKADILSISPGRVNIIGEHVDYTLGMSMPVAIDRYMCVAISKNNNQTIEVYSKNLNESFSNSIDDDMSSLPLWNKYVLGSIKEAIGELAYNSGLDIVINSDIQMGKGISSSAALEVSIVCSVLKLFSIQMKNKEIIEICQKVDHRYVGIMSGKLDQSACLLSRKDSFIIIDFLKLSIEYIPINFKEVTWVIVDSNIRRELASSKYQKRVQQCREALEILSSKDSNLKNFRDIDESKYHLIDTLPSKLRRRVIHIISENKRVLNMKDVIKNNQVSKIGLILQESHNSLRYNYQISCAEIDFLIDVSKGMDCWYGGRIMGGGFGGSMINLIKKGREDEYAANLSGQYKKKYNIDCRSMRISFVSGAETIENIRVK